MNAHDKQKQDYSAQIADYFLTRWQFMNRAVMGFGALGQSDPILKPPQRVCFSSCYRSLKKKRKVWRPYRESNPGYLREREVS